MTLRKTVAMAPPLESGREAFGRRDWSKAYEVYAEQSVEGLEAADVERMAVAAYLIGDDDRSAAAWQAAHRRYLETGDADDAARCTFWLALGLMLRGQMAQAGGWLSRAQDIVDDAGADCTATGYLMIPGLLGALDAGDPSTARDLAVEVAEIGRRLGDADLRSLGTLGHGQALIALGDTAAGTARFDEVMVSVTADEVGPIASGIVYCAVILECMQLFDVARATEWTEALSSWCDAQPDLVPYRGQCLVHRAQLQLALGDWPSAAETAETACRRLSDPPHPALGLAYYQQAQLLRLLGAYDEAEAAYRRANRSGYQPMPGLALLELNRGDARAAAATIRRALTEAANPGERPALLAAAVEIYRSTGDVPSARAAVDELDGIAGNSASEMLRAMAALATGAVLLSEGDAVTALTHLRAADAAWQHLHMPYERARTELLIGLSCAALGDRTSAALEFGSAREIFAELGARPDTDRLEALMELGAPAEPPDPTEDTRSLSVRELEVLALMAAGKTNRMIATELGISQHTVGRHVENIFAKLGVTSRAAATSHAYEHHLL